MNSAGKQKLIMLAMGILLLAAAIYIAKDIYDANRENEIFNAAQQGYTVGVTDTVQAAFEQTDDCRITTLNLGNATRQIVDFECVQELLGNG